MQKQNVSTESYQVSNQLDVFNYLFSRFWNIGIYSAVVSLVLLLLFSPPTDLETEARAALSVCSRLATKSSSCLTRWGNIFTNLECFTNWSFPGWQAEWIGATLRARLLCGRATPTIRLRKQTFPTNARRPASRSQVNINADLFKCNLYHMYIKNSTKNISLFAIHSCLGIWPLIGPVSSSSRFWGSTMV